MEKIILKKINEILPKISKKDIIILYGSRAINLARKDSDIDVMIITNNSDKYKTILVKKGFRKQGEDPGFEVQIKDKVFLEVKILDKNNFTQKNSNNNNKNIPKIDIPFSNSLLNAIALTNKIEFTKIQNNLEKQFLQNHDTILFQAYINFFNEFKQCGGIASRDDDFSRLNLEIKKGVSIQALLQLSLIMQNKTYPSDKWLAHFVDRTTNGKEILKLAKQIINITSFKEYSKTKKEIQTYINSKMQKKPYVGAWWKYLKEYNALKNS
jgi:hypothetical protein